MFTTILIGFLFGFCQSEAFSMTLDAGRTLSECKNRCSITASSIRDTLYFERYKYYIDDCKHYYTIDRITDSTCDLLKCPPDAIKLNIFDVNDRNIYSLVGINVIFDVEFVNEAIIIEYFRTDRSELHFAVLQNGKLQEYLAPKGKYQRIGQDRDNIYYQIYQYDYELRSPIRSHDYSKRPGGPLQVKGNQFFSISTSGIKTENRILQFLSRLDTTGNRYFAEKMITIQEDSALHSAVLEKSLQEKDFVSINQLIYYSGNYAVIQKKTPTNDNRYSLVKEIYFIDEKLVKLVGSILSTYSLWNWNFYYTEKGVFMYSRTEDTYQIHKFTSDSITSIITLSDFPEYFVTGKSTSSYIASFEIRGDIILMFIPNSKLSYEYPVFSYSQLTKRIRPVLVKAVVK
ncbi:MAG: hypothetical protein U0264_12030 [Candidatus Kapaibacterium sp.]